MGKDDPSNVPKDTEQGLVDTTRHVARHLISPEEAEAAMARVRAARENQNPLFAKSDVSGAVIKSSDKKSSLVPQVPRSSFAERVSAAFLKSQSDSSKTPSR